jgi:hypothetical protein
MFEIDLEDKTFAASLLPLFSNIKATDTILNRFNNAVKCEKLFEVETKFPPFCIEQLRMNLNAGKPLIFKLVINKYS